MKPRNRQWAGAMPALTLVALLAMGSCGSRRQHVSQGSIGTAQALRAAGRYADALEAARSALKAAETNPETGALQLKDARRDVKALERILSLPGDQLRRIRLADSLDVEIDSADGRSDFALMESLARRQLEIRRLFLAVDSLEYARSLGRLALALREQGEYLDSEPMFLNALAICRRTLGPDHPIVADRLHDLAMLYHMERDFGRAEDAYREALGIHESAYGRMNPETASLLRHLSSTLRDQGRYDEAEPLLLESLRIRRAIRGSESLEAADCYHSLGVLYQRRREFDTAERYIRRGLDIRRRLLPPNHCDLATSVNDLGDLYLWQEEWSRAVPLLREALRMRCAAHGPDSRIAQATEQYLGRCFIALGQWTAAESLLTDAADHYERSRAHLGCELTRANFGSPYDDLVTAKMMLGKSQEAWEGVERSCGRAIADMLMAAEGASSPTEIRTERRQNGVLDRLEGRVAELDQKIAAGPAPDSIMKKMRCAAMTQLIEERARSLELAAKRHGRDSLSMGVAFSLARIQRTLGPEDAIIGWAESGPQLDRPHAWGYVIRSEGPVRWARVETCGSKSRLPAYRVTGRLTEELAMSAGWPSRVLETERIMAEARGIYGIWMAPLIPYLEGITRLIVIPRAPLFSIPMEIMTDPSGAALIDRYEICYVPSATIHAWLAERKAEPRGERGRDREHPSRGAQRGKALFVGDPPFSNAQLAEMLSERRTGVVGTLSVVPPLEERVVRSGLLGDEAALSSLPRIPWSGVEARRCAEIVRNSTLLLGPDASEENLEQMVLSGDLARYRLIHLSTHALIDALQPERSALVLAQARGAAAAPSSGTDRSPSDGLLSVKDIVRSWRLHADLVTLSACQAGITKPAADEGFIGLASALFEVGARSLIASYWKVDDEATSILMQRFYEDLTGSYADVRNGRVGAPMTKIAALREAKSWLRDYRDPGGSYPFRHPAYWSAFVLVGSPD
jgi:CHAT domain-containing protein/tetratricopeptide (TPR) repeat protein